MNHLTNAELLSLISAGRAPASDELVALLVQRLEDSEAAWAKEKEELLADADVELEVIKEELLAEETEHQATQDKSLRFEKKAELLDLRLLTIYEKLKLGTDVSKVLAEMAGWDNGTWLEEQDHG